MVVSYALTAQELTKRVDNNRILFENFTTHFLHGAKIGILGKNGAGKSSLLKILAVRRICSLHLPNKQSSHFVCLCLCLCMCMCMCGGYLRGWCHKGVDKDFEGELTVKEHFRVG